MPRSLQQLALSLGGVRRDVDVRRLVPMRPVSGAPPLTRTGWLYEMKLDGYRMLADVHGRDVALRYRSGHDCTEAFPEVIALLRGLRARRLVLDGEVVAFDENGRPDFDRVGPRLRRMAEAKPPVVFIAFDLLAVGEVDVRPVPLVSRKQLLESVARRSAGRLRTVPYTVDDGRELAAFIVQHDLEGLVAKRADAPYVAGPSSAWVKAKRRHEEEFLVTRYRRDREGRIDALALATLRGRKARGVVELGAWRIGAALDADSGGAGWQQSGRPLLVTVTFTGTTSAGRLREPSVKCVRIDALG